MFLIFNIIVSIQFLGITFQASTEEGSSKNMQQN